MKYYLIALGGACAVTEMPTALLCQGQCTTAEDVQYAGMQDVNTFLWHYLRNQSTLDIGVLGYIGIVQHKEHSPEVLSLPPGTPCIYNKTSIE